MSALEEAKTWDAAGRGRQLKAHCSDESTAASCADTEEWQPLVERAGSHRPRVGRRAKARARREEWEEAKRQAFCESVQEPGARERRDSSLIGTLLSCIDEDGLGEDFACSSGCGSVESDSSVADNCQNDEDEEYVLPHSKRARRREDSAEGSEVNLEEKRLLTPIAPEQEKPDVDEVSEDDHSTLSSVWSMNEDENDLHGHERLVGLDRAATALPSKLVWALIHAQERADKWCREDELDSESPDNKNPTCSVSLAELEKLRHCLKHIKMTARRLDNTWEPPRHLQRQWSELLEWILEGEAGAGDQLQRVEDVLEEARDKEENGELEEDWLWEELESRCYTIRGSWEEDIAVSLAAIEASLDRQDFIAQRRADEDTNTQVALNARLAASLRNRDGFAPG